VSAKGFVLPCALYMTVIGSDSQASVENPYPQGAESLHRILFAGGDYAIVVGRSWIIAKA